MKKLLIVIVTMLAAGGNLLAQHRPQFSQYIFNQLVINPAYAGTKEHVTVNAFHRQQWSGAFGGPELEGAPNTQTLSVDGLTRNNRIGLGFHLTRDEIGLQNRKNITVDAAVKLPLSESSVISVGLGAGVSHFAVDAGKYRTGNDEQVDPALEKANKARTWSPNVNMGVFFHTERFYAGVSVTDLIGIDEDINYDPERHYFFTTGYVADLGESIKVKPSIMLKDNFDGPSNVDFNVFFLFKERIWLGASYRTAMYIFQNDFEGKGLSSKDAIVAMTDIYITPRLRFGYAYDFTLHSTLNDLSTHEISLGYSFLRKQETKMLTPRYF
ncbi:MULTISPECIES: PorP/SprF family type IX secretion system membrane protein [Rufibacter]|uniref:Type IX secretion system PorP/SprF family membrane protein n=1 Tax=Rufibacter quisquiliarum TaxID=1549639 RepID=A0A839GRW3_9BACT|nr:MULTISPECIES: type IX secretion system membrane protein PorP/SprF [Rufibacter]MBA9077576.1 type IX secretion system PorP/SprF family membrane protein [Rufibacter quisquiliarum]